MSKKVKDKEKEVKKEQQTHNQVETNAPSQQAQLTLSDLQAAVSIIDLASRRGAFQAQELATVGSVYNKLTGFLNQVAQQTQQQTQPETATPVSEESQVTEVNQVAEVESTND